MTAGSDACLAELLDALAAHVDRAACYCRLAPDARAQSEVAFRLSRGTRSVELCLDLVAQLLTPPDVLAAELAAAAGTALRPRRARVRMSADRAPAPHAGAGLDRPWRRQGGRAG